jgi:hypothetical protein
VQKLGPETMAYSTTILWPARDTVQAQNTLLLRLEIPGTQ